MTNITVIIQARVGSSRLPGKVMYPLDGQPVLKHVVKRTASSDDVTEIVVATSKQPQDDVIEQYAPEFGAEVIRGSETNVLSRFEYGVEKYESDIVVRVTGDCPLISPQFLDQSIEIIQTKDIDYVCASLDRTFPRGITCETFTTDSFNRVSSESSKPRHREHVTPYYRENPNKFSLYNIESSELFDQEWLQNRTDLRLTLDEPSDYHLFEKIYREIEYNDILKVKDAIRYIDQQNLSEINENVDQKTI
ncbi:cytidylyltransferase domain-containing protein [Halorutilales archaeon Cl-col2-1]